MTPPKKQRTNDDIHEGNEKNTTRKKQDNEENQVEHKKDNKMAKKMKGKNPCWKGYEMVGLKSKGGRKVPNCVPITMKSRYGRS